MKSCPFCGAKPKPATRGPVELPMKFFRVVHFPFCYLAGILEASVIPDAAYMDGSAFEASRENEVDAILKSIASQLDLLRPDEWKLIDDNGNTCGRAWTTED